VHGPATPNARSPRHVRVRGTTHVTASDDRGYSTQCVVASRTLTIRPNKKVTQSGLEID